MRAITRGKIEFLDIRAALSRGAACLAMLMAFLSPAGAAKIEASLGFDGYALPGKWVPVWIRCEGAPRSASIELKRLSEDGRSLGLESFPALDGLRLECPAWIDGELSSLAVRLVSGGRTLSEARLDVRARAFPGHLVLACGLGASARLGIASALMPSEPLLAVATLPSQLPANALDYDGVSAIALAGSREGFALSPAQRQALTAYVAGGGRLCEIMEGRDRPRSSAYGLGSTQALSASELLTPADWRAALGLAPYDPSLRTGAGPAAPASGAEGKPDGLARRAKLIVLAALAAWLAATLAAAALGKGGAAPIAAVAALSLGAALAGAPALDRAFIRGAEARLLVLELPESGSAFVSLRAGAYVPPEFLKWAEPRSIGGISIAYSEGEGGVIGEWRHELGKAAFSLRSASGGRMELEASLSSPLPAAIAGLSHGGAAGRARPAGGLEPPALEGLGPLAYVAAGEPAAWWSKNPGARWAKHDFPPPWLEADSAWVLGLRCGPRALPVLVGLEQAPSFGVSVQGSPLGEALWALPLAQEGAR
jgi:hypothetical protein